MEGSIRLHRALTASWVRRIRAWHQLRGFDRVPDYRSFQFSLLPECSAWACDRTCCKTFQARLPRSDSIISKAKIMPEAEPQENPVHNFIVKAVQAAWNDTHDGAHKAILLSSLGSKLKSEFGDYSAEFPKGIKEFLRTWPLVQMVQHPEIKEKIGLVPAGEPLPADVTSLFQKAGVRHPSAPMISYEQEFWNAFFKPIQSARHVVIEDGGEIKIVDDAVQPPAGSYEITKDDVFIPDPAMPMEEKVAATRAKIDSWLARNLLDRSRFFRKHASKPPSSRDRLESLKHAFEKISDADRSRILVPLDIMLKMIS